MVSAQKNSPQGEIINVNYRYKVAFTDLTRQSISQGDYVEVLNQNEVVLQLKVLEASDVLSKLGVLDPTAENVDFQNIRVGQSVRKIENPDLSDPVLADHKTSYSNIETKKLDSFGYNLVDPIRKAHRKEIQSEIEMENRLSQEAVDGQDFYQEYKELKDRLEGMIDNNLKLSENLTALINAKENAETQNASLQKTIREYYKEKDQLIETNLELQKKLLTMQSAVANKDIELEHTKAQVVSQQERIDALEKQLKRLIDLYKQGY